MKSCDPIQLIDRYYPERDDLYLMLTEHSTLVAEKAVAIARWVGADADFVYEAAMLHDIGIGWTHAPGIFCHGALPYLAHGIKGREILEREGLPRHALVCERHIGIGLTAAEIIEQNLPLPPRDMLPQNIEEEIVTYADLFFSKNLKDRHREKSIEEVRKGLIGYGEEKGPIFDRMVTRFG